MGTAPKLDRVKARPRPDMWRDDELMTLAEAAALHWPDGPLTETSLRTAARDGRLPISQIAGKFFVTRVALRSLTVCEPLRNEVPAPVPTASRSACPACRRWTTPAPPSSATPNCCCSARYANAVMTCSPMRSI